MNPHEKYRHFVKENLKTEINNIIVDLALKREKQTLMNMSNQFQTPSTLMDPNMTLNSTNNAMNKTWRSPTLESTERSFNEYARYYTNFKDKRTHGLKFVPKPVADNI